MLWNKILVKLKKKCTVPNANLLFIRKMVFVGKNNSLSCHDYGSEEAEDLAYNCWREYPRQVELDLEAQVKQLNSYILDVRCSKLEDYLKNQQWQKADRETSRVMLQTMGQEEDAYLLTNDIENFPCADLRKIDQLWVKYSKGKFGFSVQKKIYQSLGGTKEYDWKVWETFGEKVGWSKGGQWLMWE